MVSLNHIKNKNTIYISIINLFCQLRIDSPYYLDFFLKEYNISTAPKEPAFKIHLKKIKGKDFTFKIDKKQATVLFDPKNKYNDNGIDYIVRALIGLFSLEYNILILHASSYIKDGKAYIFCGPSGAGKSTIIQKISQSRILGDDTVVLKKEKDKFFVYMSPFDYKAYPDLKYQKAKLKKIFLLKQARENKIAKIDFVESLEEIIYNNICSLFYLSQGKSDPKYNSIRNHRLINVNIHTKMRNSLAEDLRMRMYKLNISLLLKIPFEKLFFTKNLQVSTYLG